MADAVDTIDDSAMSGAEVLGENNDAALSAEFRRAGTGTGLDEHQENDDKPQGETPGIDLASIQSQLDELREQNQTLRVENDVYRQGLLNRPREIIRETPAPAPTEKPKSFAEKINVDEINEGLRTNPAATIAKLIRDAHEAAKEEISQEVTQKATETMSGMTAQQRAFQQDQSAAMAEFGDLLSSNQEFKNLANSVYNQLVEDGGIPMDKNGNMWKPNAIYSAMAIAHSQLVRQGKIKMDSGDQGEQQVQNRGTVVPLVPRKKPPMDSMLGDTKQSGSGENSLLAGLSGEDIQQMRRAAQGLGVPFERYVKTFRTMQKRDPAYARG